LFKQTDAARLYRAAIAGGMHDPQVEIDLETKKMTVRSGMPGEMPKVPVVPDDEWAV
jgi:hypothetical protein